MRFKKQFVTIACCAFPIAMLILLGLYTRPFPIAFAFDSSSIRKNLFSLDELNKTVLGKIELYRKKNIPNHTVLPIGLTLELSANTSQLKPKSGKYNLYIIKNNSYHTWEDSLTIDFNKDTITYQPDFWSRFWSGIFTSRDPVNVPGFFPDNTLLSGEPFLKVEQMGGEKFRKKYCEQDCKIMINTDCDFTLLSKRHIENYPSTCALQISYSSQKNQKLFFFVMNDNKIFVGDAK